MQFPPISAILYEVAIIMFKIDFTFLYLRIYYYQI